MNSISVTEKVIEDIFSADRSILAGVLSVNQGDLSPIARQKKFDNRRILDLLYLHQNELLLIELKAVPFYFDIIEQINDYQQELLKLQFQSKLIKAKINKIILVTDASKEHFIACEKEEIKLIRFDIEEILFKYYQNFRELSAFLKIQPGNWGVTRLYLLKNTLALLKEGVAISEICKIENKSIKTITNRLAVASLIGLLEKNKTGYSLTKLGKEVISKEDYTSEERFNAEQFDLISEFVKDNPFYSQITFSIMSVVDTIFILSKAEYPIKYEIFQDFFVRSLGKDKTWTKPRAQLTGTYHFANYAEELGFIQKVDNHLFLTPKGIQAILIFQLNRSIKLINARK
ncbi:MAG: hypothetical protein UU48_C0021G0002 [Candidatus Uhrbacteria bacterium GW2011_GWF2_41_16]|uniref:Uncharacterized protein n=1 Tax=Candidatus Uhrbacteria bacterium GW2011_GWF2_41_16 TaxID=1618997 RepID=A0A0G0Y9I0_9BACT|nr:MAG: hypothetical protein UU48_C0021G0002 [Candidatus Uhrbacteria bacterium GW2011_GWF2_41_16]